MSERPQRAPRGIKKEYRHEDIMQKVNTLLARKLDQGEIFIAIKYFNGGICSAIARVIDEIPL